MKRTLQCATLLFCLFLFGIPAFANLSVFEGTFTKNTTTAGFPVSQSVTGVGFTPKVIIFFHAPGAGAIVATQDPPVAAVGGYGISITTGASQSYAMITGAGNGIFKAFEAHALLFATGSAVSVSADLTSFDADGFTLSFTANDSNAAIVGFLALGGTDILGAKIVEYSDKTSTGTKAFTGMGFKPTAIFLIGSNLGSEGYNNGDSTASIGAATGSSSWTVNPTSATTGNHRYSYQDTTNVRVQYGGTSQQIVASLTSLDSDGFTLNYATAAGGAGLFAALGLNMTNVAVGSFNKATATGSQSVTGVPFAPTGIMLFSDAFVASTLQQSNYHTSVSAFTSTARSTYWGEAPDATISGDVGYTSSKVSLFGSGTTTTNEASVTSLDSAGFTLNWTTSDANADQILYFALGAASSTRATMPPVVF